MLVSTKGRYGLRILLDVALHQESGPVSLRDVSLRQSISQKYLWQVINPLKGAGVLRSTRGAHGGYVLARSPQDISLLDIVTILEGPVSIVPCRGAPGACASSASCTARDAWAEVEDKLSDAMRGITLKDLIQRHREKESRIDPSFMI